MEVVASDVVGLEGLPVDEVPVLELSAEGISFAADVSGDEVCEADGSEEVCVGLV